MYRRNIHITLCHMFEQQTNGAHVFVFFRTDAQTDPLAGGRACSHSFIHHPLLIILVHYYLTNKPLRTLHQR